MPEIERHEPQHLQIASYYKQQIITGDLPSKSQLPSVRTIASDWNVSHGIAQRAVDHLKTEGLVHTSAKGTFVNGNRAKLGPQQRMRVPEFPMAERVEIRAAELTEAPPYIVPILGLEPAADGVTRVIRREWVTYEDGSVPFMLSASWCAPEAAMTVPELLRLSSLLDAGDAAKLIASRTGREVTWGRSGREARQIKDDGREGPLLRLPKTARVLAEVYTWAAGDDVLEYGEYILIEGRVIESDMEP